MQQVVSIIIPVYNVKKYLEKCITSVQQQSYSKLQIILVDDGSTDGSSVICDYYAKKDNRIKVIHKTNGGLSSARNVGLEHATGDFLAFVDSDDYIESDMIERLLEQAIENNVDIVQCGINYVCEKGNILSKKNCEEYKYETNSEILEAFFEEKISVMVWNKIYRTEYIKDIRMIEGKNNEDNMYTIDVLIRTNKVICIPEAFYNYTQRANSITKTSFTDKKLDSIYAGQYVINVCEKYKPEYVIHAKINLCLIDYYLYFDLLHSKVTNNKKYKEIIILNFKENYNCVKETMEFRKLKKKNKIKLILFAKSRFIAQGVYKLHHIVNLK